MNRRSFIKSSVATSAAALLSSCVTTNTKKANVRYVSPNSKLNVAMIGAGGQGRQAFAGSQDENWVALCDVDSRKFEEHVERFPDISKARRFTDYRVMLDKMGDEIDLVCVNTPDHTHFPASMAAMERGIHVFTQKPLVHDVWQARTLKTGMGCEEYENHQSPRTEPIPQATCPERMGIRGRPLDLEATS